MTNSIKLSIGTSKGTIHGSFANTTRVLDVILFTIKHFKLKEDDTYLLCRENGDELEAYSTLRQCGLEDNVVLSLENLCNNGRG